MLRANGQADGIWPDALLCQFFLRTLSMGCGGRMDDKGFYIRHIGQQRKQFQIVYKLHGFFRIAPDLKGKDRTAATGEILPVQRLLALIFGHTGMMHCFPLVVIF